MGATVNQNQKDNLAGILGIPPETQQALDAGSNHPYTCKCEMCAAWWVHMGPDGGEPGNYGPFNTDEIREQAIKMNMLAEFESAERGIDEELQR